MANIGSKQISGNLFLAPMAGYTNASFRKLLASLGADLTTTEMVSVLSVLFKNKKTNQLLQTSNNEKVKCVQLFGYNPNDFFKCASLSVLDKFDIIDVNMGCPVKKVFSIGQGCALMADVDRACDIVKALKDAGKTVSVKTRLGIENPHEILSFAPKIQNAGADLIAIHCRTARQMYTGNADYSLIGKLKQMLTIPVGINGDIKDINSFNLAKQTGADVFLIGRGALHNPFIFQLLKGQTQSLSSLDAILTLVDYMEKDLTSAVAVRELRKFMPFLLKPFTTKSQRHALNFLSSTNELRKQIISIFSS